MQGKAINFKEQRGNSIIEIVKMQTSIEEELNIKPQDSAIVFLNLTISEIDIKTEELNKTKEFLHKQILSQLKLQNKINAKHFLMRKKMVEEKIKQLLGSRLNIEEQLLALSSSVTNKNILDSIKLSNSIFKETNPDMREAIEIIDTSKEYLDNYRDVSNMLGESLDVENDEELLREFESLDQIEIPSVPNYTIPARKIVQGDEPNYSFPARKVIQVDESHNFLNS